MFFQGMIAAIRASTSTSVTLQLAKVLREYAKLEDPNIDYPPVGISKEALPIWRDIMKKYCDVIFDGTDKHIYWAKAINIFESSCKSRNIQAWE